MQEEFESHQLESWKDSWQLLQTSDWMLIVCPSSAPPEGTPLAGTLLFHTDSEFSNG